MGIQILKFEIRQIRILLFYIFLNIFSLGNNIERTAHSKYRDYLSVLRIKQLVGDFYLNLIPSVADPDPVRSEPFWSDPNPINYPDLVPDPDPTIKTSKSHETRKKSYKFTSYFKKITFL